MSNLALFAIADQYLADVKKLEDLDIDEQTFADTLEGLSGDLEVKATNVALFVRNLEASADAIEQAEKQMADRRKALENKSNKIREYLLANMLRTGIRKIDCPYLSLTVKKNPPAVEILNPDMIPAQYLEIPEPPPPTISKKLIKEALSNGVEVDGARLTQSKRLEIK
jgi:chromatin segregation and condensation protein Rec8/ScpA/Scc1 (kleisin family)